jgi:hypothetical protein
MSEKTAVDFAFEKLANQGLLITKDYKNLVAYREAKQMEREQTLDFTRNAVRKILDEDRQNPFNLEQYYNETYGGQDE